MADNVAIALQGCIHGEIDSCYRSIEQIMKEGKWNILSLLWAGDVQTVRDQQDLASLACPPKFRAMKDFHYYYSLKKEAPLLTLFIGGNHEASSFLHPLWLGGWVAPNIYYFGRSGIVTIGKTRIAGLSGIYKYHDYHRAYYEEPPFDSKTIRSVYHVREIEVKRLMNIQGPVDVVLSHDWPTQVIQNSEDQMALLKKKPYFRDDLHSGRLGNPHLMEILDTLRPPVWVAAHLHVNFQCTYKHSTGQVTRFVTHDKPKKSVSTSLLRTSTNEISFCYRPAEQGSSEEDRKRRKVDDPERQDIMLDLEWLLILKASWNANSNQAEYSFRLTWKAAKEIALVLEKHALANWWESIQSLQGDASDDDPIPPSTPLWNYRFAYPSWQVLDWRNPRGQTEWWCEILGIALDASLPPTGPKNAPSTDLSNPLLGSVSSNSEEEEIELS